MVWIIVIQLIIIFILVLLLLDSQKAIRTMVKMWEEEQNRKWLKMMEETGVEIIRLS